MRPEEESFIEDKTGQNWMSMFEASSRCSYSQEYLSLLARRGKIFAQKIGRNWYTTEDSLNEYLKKQSLTITVPRNVLGRLTSSVPLTPEEPEAGDKSDTGHESHSKVFEEFERLNPQLFQAKKSENLPAGETIKFPSEKVVQSTAPAFQKQDDVLNKLDRLSDSLGNFAERITRKLDQPKEEPLTPEQEEFFEVQLPSFGYRFKIFDRYARSMMRSPVRMMTIMITAVVAIFIIAGGFSFGQVDHVVQQIRDTFKNADTLQGHFPGTHANEVLVLDKAGNVSIFGHIETQGQLRSFASDGVAPLVVDSMTLVDNLNANYLDGLASKDFTLAFVTKNGNITHEDVFLEGNVEVGKTLTVKGAAKLLDSLQVYGTLGVFSDAVFGRNVTLTNGDLSIKKGTIKIFNTALIKNLNAEFLDGLRKNDINLDFVTSNGASTANGITIGALEVNGQSDFRGMGFFHEGVWGSDGAFGTLGVSGDAIIGSQDKPEKSSFQVYSKKFQINQDGNVGISGKTTTADLVVSKMLSDLISSGSFDLGSSTNRWVDVFAQNLNLSGTFTASGSVNFAGTSSNSFTINTDNATADTENSYLSFERGTTTPNATLKWNSTNNRFEFNEPLFVASSSAETIFSVSGGPASVSNTLYVQNGGNVGIGTTSPGAKLDVVGRGLFVNSETQGTASASYLLTGNTLQVGGFASAAYSRFGTLTLTTNPAGNWITTTNDVLVSGDLYGVGSLAFAGPASISNTLFVGTGGKTGNVGIGTTAPLSKLEVSGGRLEVGGTASASYLLTGNTLQVGGFASAAYSRFGTLTTGHSNYISASNDLLISGDLEVKGTASFAGGASISGNFNLAGDQTISGNLTVNGTGSSSFAGSLNVSKGIHGLADITATGRFIGYSTASNSFAGSLDITKGLRVTGNITNDALSASRLVFSNGSKVLSSVSTLTGWIAGTSNQITVTDDLDGSVTLSLPQNIHTGASPTFAGLTLTGNLTGINAEFQGTASASYLLTGNTLQVGGYASAAYSRFGTDETGYSNFITTTNDLLISGDLEVNASANFDGNLRVGNGSTPALFVQSGNGNVGIGTTGPLTTLHVKGSVADDKIRAQGLVVGDHSFIGSYNSAGTVTGYFGATRNSADGAGRPADSVVLLTGTNSPLVFSTNENERMRITGAGNVGIGTATPTSLLTVQGRGEFQGTASASYLLTGNTLQVGGFASAAYSRFGTSTLTTNPAGNWITTTNDVLVSGDLYGVGSLAFAGPASISNTLFVGTGGKTGNVGIGTTGPINKLEVEGGDISFGSSTTNLRKIIFGSNNGNDYLGFRDVSSGTNALEFAQDGSIKFVIDGVTGNVGIGNTVPDTKLDITGTASASLYYSGDGVVGAPGYSFSNDPNTGIYRGGTDILSFATGGSERVRINANGNVGINYGGNLDTFFEVGGTASISGNLLLGGIQQTSGTSSSSFAGLLQLNATPTGTGISQGSLYLNPKSAGTNNVIIGVAVNSTEKLRIDAEGDVQTVGLFNSTNTSGTNQLSGNLQVDGNTTLGNATSDTITATGRFSSHLIPSADLTYNLGDPSLRWDSFYVASLSVTNLFAGGTASSSFVINKDNTTNDAEDSFLEFERGTATPNAKLQWDSANDQFVFNYPISTAGSVFGIGTASSSFAGPVWFTGTPTGTNLQSGSVYINPGSAATNYTLFGIGVAGVERFRVDAEGDTTIAGDLGVENQIYDITEDTLRINDDLQINGNDIKDSGTTVRITLGATTTLTATVTDLTGDLEVSGLDIRDSGGTNRITFTTLGATGLTSVTGALDTTTYLKSGDELIVTNAGQFAGTATVAYSRFGTTATTHALSATNDLLINGKLEVDGTAYFDGTVNFPSIASASLFHAQDGTAASPSYTFAIDKDTGMFRPVVNQLAFSTLGTERLRIDNLGNVGIGTTGPTSLLTVQGRGEFQGTASASYLLTGNTLQVGGFASAAYSRFGTSTLTTNPAGNWITGSNDLLISGDLYGVGSIAFAGPASISNTLFVGTGGKTGNVGIGTTGPASALHIGGTGALSFGTSPAQSGNIRVPNNTTIIAARRANDLSDFVVLVSDIQNNITISAVGDVTISPGTGAIWDFKTGAGNPLQPRGDNDTDFGGTATRVRTGYFGTSIVDPLLIGGSAVGSSLELKSTSGVGTTDFIKFTVGNNGGTEAMRIIDSGNVGIGTTGPTSRLNVEGGRLEVGGTASASYFLTGNTLQVGGFASAAYSRFGTSTTGHSNYISASNDLLISGDLETRGTASFGGVASVSGNFFTYGTNTFSGAGSSSFAGSLSVAKGFLAGANNALVVNGAATANTLNIVGANVGIGTTGPGAKLHVSDTSQNADLKLESTYSAATDGRARLVMTAVDRQWIVQLDGTGDLWKIRDDSAGEDRLVINYGGNVGIGTTGPGSALHVISNVDSEGITLERTSATTGKYSFGLDTAGNLKVSETGVSARLTVLKTSGNVGIGTTGPVGKLEIRGTTADSPNFALNLSDVDVAHVITGWAPAATYGFLNILNSTAGGLQVFGASDAAGVRGLELNGFIGVTDPTDTVPAIWINGGKSDGTNQAALGAAETVLQIANGGTAAVTLLGSGNVGIGTTGPGSKLDVLGGWANIRAGTSGITQQANGELLLSSTGPKLWIEDTDATSGQRVMKIHTSSGLTKFESMSDDGVTNTVGNILVLEHSTGNVGIGNTSPDSKLDVTGTASASLYYSGDGTVGAPGYSFSQDPNTGIYRGGTDILSFATGGSERVRINASGNVGLNYGGNLDTFFEVGGTASISGNLLLGGIQQTSGTSSSSFAGLLQLNATPAGTGISQGSLYINPKSAGTNNVIVGIAVNSTEKLRIDAEGDVQTVGLFNSTNTSGTNQLSGNLQVDGNTTLGNATSDTIATTGRFNSDILPSADLTYNLGSSVLRWDNVYFGSASITNLFAGGTASSSFIINSDNTTADAEDSQLEFERGTTIPNAILKWDSTNDRFDFNNFPVRLQNQLIVAGTTSSSSFAGPTWFTGTPTGTALANGSVFINPSSGPTNNTLFAIAVAGSERLRIDAEGDATIQGDLGVENQIYDITEDTLRINDDIQINGNDIKDSGTVSRISLGATTILTNTITDLTGDLEISGGDIRDSGGTNRVTFSTLGTTGLTSITGALDTTTYLKSGDELIITNAAQFAGASTASYSRFGTVATSHGLSATNDLLINGKLEVDGTSYFDGTTNFFGIASSSLFYAQPGTAASPSFSFAIDQDTGMFRPAINQLGFSTLGIERLRINSDGNVGINAGGTIDTKFEVGGTASIGGNLTTYGANTFSGTGSSSFSGSVDISKGLRVGANTALSVNANASANTLVLVGGNVGIGTTGPVYTLDIQAPTGSARITSLTGTDPVYQYFANTGGSAVIGVDSSTGNSLISSGGLAYSLAFVAPGTTRAIQLATNNAARLTIDSTGNVGIGTTAPTSKLEVLGGRLEVGGTASASYLLTGNTIQVGGFASVSYNRFGTSTTGHSPTTLWLLTPTPQPTP
ncbi:MAG: hypothetical protein HYT67_00490 [Candidatus Yanofskybacteria bacterium]|nr:hypothetical protein [Candidatus Yanofskybacteria bacterium]